MFRFQARKPVNTYSKGNFRRLSLATGSAKPKSRRLSMCKEQESRRISEREILKRELENFKQKVSNPTKYVSVHITHTTRYTDTLTSIACQNESLAAELKSSRLAKQSADTAVGCEKNEVLRLQQELANANDETEKLKAHVVKYEAEQSQSKDQTEQQNSNHDSEQLQSTEPQACRIERQGRSLFAAAGSHVSYLSQTQPRMVSNEEAQDMVRDAVADAIFMVGLLAIMFSCLNAWYSLARVGV